MVSDRAGRELQVVVGSCTQESCETGKVCQAHATQTADREAGKHVRLWALFMTCLLTSFPCTPSMSLSSFSARVRERREEEM